MRTLKFILLLAVFAACKVGPNYKRSELAANKKSFVTPSNDNNTKDSIALLKWFELYNDNVLQDLLKTALANNLDMKLTLARIEEARENAGVVKANLLPSLGYQLGVSNSAASANAVDARLGMPYNNGFATVNLKWEIDLFGKIRNARTAAINTLNEQIELRKNLSVVLVAEVADNYFLLRDLDNRLSIAQRTLLSRKESLRINNERFAKGYNAELDLLQAQMQYAAVEAAIPGIQRQIILVQNGINLLLGRSGGEIARGKTNAEQNFVPSIPAGLPSQLLERRPDIKAAEFNLMAQTNRIGVAMANRFPTLSLTASKGIGSSELSSLINANSIYGSLAASLTGPIFAFKQNKRRVEIERQRAIQAQAIYEKTVLQAFLEVDNSLSNHFYLGKEFEARNVQVKAGKKALELSQQRFNFGYTSYLEVLVQENALFDAEIQESITLRQKHSALVNLYKALGGGW